MNRKLNFSDASLDVQRGSEDTSIGSEVGGIPGSPVLSSCSEGEPPHSPIENYLSPNRSRSPILSSSLPPHSTTTQNDVDSLRLLLQEVFYTLFFISSMWYISGNTSSRLQILFLTLFVFLVHCMFCLYVDCILNLFVCYDRVCLKIIRRFFMYVQVRGKHAHNYAYVHVSVSCV